MNTLREYKNLKKILGTQIRSKNQCNRLFESDCEIVKVGPKNFITTSTDSIGEEITIGLYKEVETWAWMTVMSSVSDLCASGSKPLGLTISTQWAFETPETLQKLFFAGVKNACKKAKVPLLGGDSGYAKDHVMTSNILGHSTSMPLTRIGAQDGDYLVLANKKTVGVGPALAYRFLKQGKEELLPESIFRPTPSWELAQKIRPWATAAIDTSDGLAAGMYTLALLNDLGFEINWIEKLNHPQALNLCSAIKFSPIMLWLGDLGDLQTLFVIPKKNINKIPKNKITVLGQFKNKKINKGNYILNYKNQAVEFPMEKITNCPRDVDSYSALIKENNAFLAKFK